MIAHYPVVAQAAAHIAGPTHRNMGTVGGNLCLDTRCIYYNQSEWWRAANHHCLKTTGDDLPRRAEEPRRVLCDLQRRSRAGAADARRRGRSRRARRPAHDAAREPLYRLCAAGRAGDRDQGDGKYFLSLRPGEFVTAVRAQNTPGLRSAYDKIRIRRSIEYPVDRRRGGAAPRGRHARRPARRLHRHQSAPGAARGHRGALRRCARRARVHGPRRARARPDHGDEDDVHARPLPPPRRRRAGAPAGAAVVRRI